MLMSSCRSRIRDNQELYSAAATCLRTLHPTYHITYHHGSLAHIPVGDVKIICVRYKNLYILHILNVLRNILKIMFHLDFGII